MIYPLMKNNITRDDLDKVIDLLKKNDPILTNGPLVKEFEKKWSEWLGVKKSVFLNSGASSNLLSLAILKILHPNGGEVIVPPITWVSDISSVIQNGFKPKFVDINMSTLCMDTNQIINNYNKNTKAIFITHAQGFNGLSDKLLEFIDEKKIFLIEDVCESHGATFKNKKLGTYGHISNFSFYYAHHMSTIEGGMLCTNDDKIYQIARMLRSHGMVRELENDQSKEEWINNNPELNPDFIFSYQAYNLRNNEIGATIGINQLERLDENIKIRNRNHKYFLKKINNIYFFNEFNINGSSNYAFNLVARKGHEAKFLSVMENLKLNKIEFRRGSAGGGNQLRQPYLKNMFPENFFLNFPNSDFIHFNGLYIGNYPDLNLEDIDFICKVINEA